MLSVTYRAAKHRHQHVGRGKIGRCIEWIAVDGDEIRRHARHERPAPVLLLHRKGAAMHVTADSLSAIQCFVRTYRRAQRCSAIHGVRHPDPR
jgi:hypothetical protein